MNVNAPGRDGKTALIAASEEARLPTVERLIAGADLNASDNKFQRRRSCSRRRDALGAELLLDKADPRVQLDQRDDRAAFRHHEIGQDDCADAGPHHALLDDRDKEGRTALIWASGTGNIEIARTPLQHGADAQLHENSTALTRRRSPRPAAARRWSSCCSIRSRCAVAPQRGQNGPTWAASTATPKRSVSS